MKQRMATRRSRLRPIHPGEILQEEFLRPLGVSMSRLAREIHVSRGRVRAVINGSSTIRADLALRLGRYFGTSAELWMNLQSDYNLRSLSARSLRTIEREVTPRGNLP